MIPMGTLQGRRILVIEDDYFIARDMAKHLKESGAEIVGPVGTIEDALDIIGAAEPLDGAILDINLGGELAFPVADALRQRRVAFVFVTGYDDAIIPARYSAVRRCEKPVEASKIASALFG
jgi:DNA-binding LytR/AlgR family response regulator